LIRSLTQIALGHCKYVLGDNACPWAAQVAVADALQLSFTCMLQSEKRLVQQRLI
jgi:hypothetical protein